MAEVIILLGQSGSGKSASLRNMPVNESIIISPNTKPLSFKGGDKKWGKRKILAETMNDIKPWLEKASKGTVKYVIIEDFSHYFHNMIMSPRFMAQGDGNAAFQRWKVLAKDTMSNVFFAQKELREDMKIILLHHVEETQAGKEVFKIFGKLLGESLDPVSYVRIVWHCRVIMEKTDLNERYVIQVNDDGTKQAKSPMGMFQELYQPNDLYKLLQVVEEYDKEG